MPVCKFVIQSAVGSAMIRIAINSFEGRTDKVITSRILLTWLFVLGVGYLSRFSLFQDPEETLYNYPANNQYERTGYLQIFREKINKKINALRSDFDCVHYFIFIQREYE